MDTLLHGIFSLVVRKRPNKLKVPVTNLKYISQRKCYLRSVNELQTTPRWSSIMRSVAWKITTPLTQVCIAMHRLTCASSERMKSPPKSKLRSREGLHCANQPGFHMTADKQGASSTCICERKQVAKHHQQATKRPSSLNTVL